MFWFSYSRPRKIMWGLFWILLGIFLLLSNHGLLGYHFSFSRDWPILLIAWGLMKLVDLAAWRNKCRCHRFKIINTRDEDQERSPKVVKSEILNAVAEGRMTAEEAAARLKNL